MKQDINPINMRIATYRKLAGYTQQAAADALNIKKSTYARMELRGNPTPDMLKKLSKLYGVSSLIFLYGIDEQLPKNPKNVYEPTKLEEEVRVFKKPDLVLSVNEINCIKACRKLSKKQQNQVMEFINKLYREKRMKGN